MDFLAGTTGSAAKQYYVDGKIDAGESITRGLTNAVGQLPYNIKGLKNLKGIGGEAIRGGLTGAGEAGIRYITDHIGKDPAQVRMGTGLLPAIAGNFSPSELLRDPKRGCGSESPFAPGLGYHSARGYRYDVPRISESKSNKASLGGFLKETGLGGLMGGLASAAFYRVGKGIDKLKESVLPRRAEVKYSPVNPGPLKENIANSFNGATYTERVLTEDTIMYRVSGGDANRVGSYLSMTPQNGGLQSQLDLALNPAWGNTTENVVKVVVPKGTIIYEGIAAPQNIYDSLKNVIGTLPGGGSQVYIPKVKAEWFK